MLKNYIRHRMADKKINGTGNLMDLSGLSRSVINKLYRDVNVDTIKICSLITLCDTLDCKLSDLIEYEPEPKQPNK